MYKIQIGWEDGYYVAYLAKHIDLYTEATVEDEIYHFEINELIAMIPEEWKTKLTNFLNN